MYAEVLQEVSKGLTALQEPIKQIESDIQTIAGEMDGISDVANRLVKQIDKRDGMIAQIAETVRKIIEKLNNVFK